MMTTKTTTVRTRTQKNVAEHTETLTQLCFRKKVSVTSLAAQTGCSKSGVSYILRGERGGTMVTLAKMAGALGVSLDYMAKCAEATAKNKATLDNAKKQIAASRVRYKKRS